MCEKIFGTVAEEYGKLGLRSPTPDEMLDGFVLGYQQAAEEAFAAYKQNEITGEQYREAINVLRHAARHAGEQTQALVKGEATTPRDDAWNIVGDDTSGNSTTVEI